jgi:hypothetical protein
MVGLSRIRLRRDLRQWSSLPHIVFMRLGAAQPRPANGIVLAITVMNITFASSGKPTM